MKRAAREPFSSIPRPPLSRLLSRVYFSRHPPNEELARRLVVVSHHCTSCGLHGVLLVYYVCSFSQLGWRVLYLVIDTLKRRSNSLHTRHFKLGSKATFFGSLWGKQLHRSVLLKGHFSFLSPCSYTVMPSSCILIVQSFNHSFTGTGSFFAVILIPFSWFC